MEHEHTEHVAASPDRVFAAIANPENLPHYVPQLTAVRRGDGDKLAVEARYAGYTQHGEAWFRADESRRRIEWGAPDSEYRGWIEVSPDEDGSRLVLFLTTARGDASDAEVMGTLDAMRLLVEADV
ncbi:MAG TPA: SRPBCC family protein [Solirubrobacteraceae bacterium]|nr:SRPBCC family protein [Solirubrobacteraceae bacterium]